MAGGLHATTPRRGAGRSGRDIANNKYIFQERRMPGNEGAGKWASGKSADFRAFWTAIFCWFSEPQFWTAILNRNSEPQFKRGPLKFKRGPLKYCESESGKPDFDSSPLREICWFSCILMHENQQISRRLISPHPHVLAFGRSWIVYNISKNTYFGVGSSNIANQKLKKQVLTQNFILNRMPLFSASESQYNISKQTILQFCLIYAAVCFFVLTSAKHFVFWRWETGFHKTKDFVLFWTVLQIFIWTTSINVFCFTE